MHQFRLMMTGLAANALILFGLMMHNRLLIDPQSWLLAAVVAVGLGLALARQACGAGDTRPQRRMRDFAECALALMVICLVGAVGSYESAAATTGFYDQALAHIDEALHFHWVDLYRVIAAHPALQLIGAAAYASVFLSPWILIGWFVWHGDRVGAARFLFSFWLSSILTLMVFPFVPARGPLEFLWRGRVPYMPSNGIDQGTIIAALRQHSMSRIELDSVHGLVCAPSFHTVCAVLFMTAAWPVPALRRWLVPLNLLMLLAIPVEGTHYLADMLMGAVVALIALGIVHLTIDVEPTYRRSRPGMSPGLA